MRNKGKVFWRMITTGFFLLLISVLISMMIYNYSYEIIKGQETTYNENLLSTLRSISDSEMQYYAGMLKQICRNDTMRMLTKDRGKSSTEIYWDEYLVKKELSNMYNVIQGNNTSCYDIFIWQKEEDKIINYFGAMSYSLYTEMMWVENEDGALYLKKEMEQMKGNKEIGISDKNNSYIVLLSSVMGMGHNKKDVVAGICINVQEIEKRIQSENWTGGIDWMILNENNEILRKPKGGEPDEETIMRLAEEYPHKITIDEKVYFAQKVSSQMYDWDYILLAPNTIVNGATKKLRAINYISMLAMLLVGGFITFWFSKKQYSSLEKVLDLFPEKRKEERSRKTDEYAFIKAQASRLISRNNEMLHESKISKQNEMHNKQIGLLLNGKSNNELGEKFKQGKNVVLVLTIEKTWEQTEKEKNLKYFIVQNVFAEGIGEHFELEIFEYNEKIVLIVNVDSNNQLHDHENLLKDTAIHLQNYILEHFYFFVRIFEGGFHDDEEGIQLSWLEVSQVMEMNETTGFLSYEEIRDISIYTYGYSIEIEQRVINAVRNRDIKMAKAVIDKLIENTFDKKENVISELQTCIIYDVFSTLVKVSEEQGINISMLPSLNLKKYNEVNIKMYFHNILDIICEDNNTVEEKSYKKQLCEACMLYIRENYSNPDLNLSLLAYQFHMSPAWLSEVFRREMGISVLSVIKKERVEKAQELLETGISVNKVAEQVGFRDSNSFIRIFKESTGITPGQVKKISKK